MPVKKNMADQLAKQVKANRKKKKESRITCGSKKVYDDRTKMKMCVRMRDEEISVNQLSKETGIPWTTLKSWKALYSDLLLDQFLKSPGTIVPMDKNEIVHVRFELQQEKEAMLADAIETQRLIIKKLKENLDNPKLTQKDLAYSGDVMNKIIVTGINNSSTAAEDKKQSVSLLDSILKMYESNADDAKIQISHE